MAKSAPQTKRPTAAREYQTLEVTDLSGGLDLRRSPTLLASDRARVLTNYSLQNPGELVVRSGYMQFSTSLGAGRMQGGQRVYLGSTQVTLVAWNGGVYLAPDASSLVGPPAYSTISPDNQVFFPYDRTLVAVLDGANRPRKSTNGTAWTRMGIDAPTLSTLAASASSGALLANIYEVGVSYKDRGLAHESNVGSTRRITLPSTGAIDVQVANSSDAQVDAFVVYARNVTAGEDVLRKVSSQVQSAGTSSTYVIQSSNWSANDEAPTNHNVPDAYRFAVVWKNRWWAADGIVGNRLHFTELFQNQSWPTLFYIDIPFERGDEITALMPLGDTLLVFGQSKVFLILGQTSLDFEVRPSAGTQTGALGPRCVEAIENGIVHLSADGLNIYDGAADKLLTFDIEPAIRDLVKNSASTSLELCDLVYHFPAKELRVSVPRLYPTAARGELVLDLNRTRESQSPAWTTTDRSIGGYILMDGDEPLTGNRGRLLSWSPTAGQLFEESTGTTANSSNMTAEYEGSHLSVGLHRARFIDSYGEYEPHAGSFTEEVLVDGVSQGQQTIAIGSGVATYGSAEYGVDAYGGTERRTYYTMLPLSAEGRVVWKKTIYTGQESFRLFTQSVGLVPESAPRRFSE